MSLSAVVITTGDGLIPNAVTSAAETGTTKHTKSRTTESNG